jgi:hypothetical protein
MLKDGKYTAWFRTSHGEGTGIVQLADGKISGGDSVFTHSGSYQVDDDDRFTAAITTRRYAEGPPTVFGVDEVEVKLTGKSNGTIASCSGTSEQAPSIAFEATLFLGSDQPPAPASKGATLNLNASKLPKGTDSRWRAPNPFGRGLSRI